MCPPKPKITTTAAPPPEAPIAPVEPPKGMASADEDGKKRKAGGLSQLRIGNRSGAI